MRLVVAVVGTLLAAPVLAQDQTPIETDPEAQADPGAEFQTPEEATVVPEDEAALPLESTTSASPPPAVAPPPAAAPPPSTAARSTPPPARARSGPAPGHVAVLGVDETGVEGGPEDSEEDGDRFRAFYLEASAGYSFAHLGVIQSNNLVPELQSLKGSGFAVGAGAGFFVWLFTLGIQAEWARHTSFDIGTVSLDVGLRLPTPLIEPYVRVGVGYAWMANLDQFEQEADSAIRGVAVDIGLGFDFMVGKLVAIGIGTDIALFNGRRAGVAGVPSPSGIVLADDGDAVGVQVSVLAQLNLHF